MYDADGKVIGINTAADAGRFRQGSQESYAIPIDTAESIADQIRSGKGSDTVQIGVKGFLGVQVAQSDRLGAVGGRDRRRARRHPGGERRPAAG